MTHPDAYLVQGEFPDFPEEDIPPDIPAFMQCTAWHNDTAPTWGNVDNSLLLSVDYSDKSLSEFPDHGACLHVWIDGDLPPLYEGNDWAAARLALWVAHIGIGFHPDTRGASYDPPFTPEEVAQYDRMLVDAADSDKVGDISQFALNVWAALGLITQDEARG